MFGILRQGNNSQIRKVYNRKTNLPYAMKIISKKIHKKS